MGCVLCVNAGSSSLKFALYDVGEGAPLDALTPRLSGAADGLGAAAHLRAVGPSGEVVLDHRWAPQARPTHEAVFAELLGSLGPLLGGRTLLAAGHRIVHGGTLYRSPVRLTARVLEDLRRLEPLAPLHQPHNLAAAAALLAARPDLPQVGCFDTAFHADQPDLSTRYALPEALHAAGVRRFGFHGLSYEYIVRRLNALSPDAVRGRLIVAHLGAGASMCALLDGRSMDTTMGMTALDGLVMATRCGSIDPGVVLHLQGELAMTSAAAMDLLYNRSGLLGVSGESSDMRALLASASTSARPAVDLFTLQATRQAGALAAVLGGLDGLVFTAGIGENAPQIRGALCARLGHLGVVLDPVANGRNADVISAPESRVTVRVMATNEQLMIAAHVLESLAGSGGPGL